MVYFGFFIGQMISFSHFTQIIHNIEDEIYSVGLGQKMTPRLVKEISFQLFHIIITGFSLENLY